MRENLKLFPQKDFPFGTDCFKRRKTIRIFHSPSQIGQSQIAAIEIAKIENRALDFHDTAIILCDEELLLPVISAIPKEIETVNVTMGLPLKQTPLFSLISLLISLQKKAKREGERLSFHYKSVSELLNNQFIQSIYPVECKSIVEKIVKNNLLYVPVDEVTCTDLFKKIFVCKETVGDLPEYFLSILFDLFLFWEKNKDCSFANIYQEYIYQVYLLINKLNDSLFVKGKSIMGNDEFLSRDGFFNILLQYLETLSISFEGEPLAGLQIMGILETRALDFRNLILLSVNEGIMPKANASGSFIPYHLRKGVGLPAVEEQNAMYAYYFYRLLQRAETITFVYNSGSNGLKTGEKSRFLHQLLLESPFIITEEGIENTIDPVSTKPIIIEKKGHVLELLNGFIESGKSMTPTALVQYVQCPLSYYFKYIARFEEEDEVTEEVDARIFGTLFHSVMETLYRPHLKMSIDENIIQSLVEHNELIENSLMDSFRTHFFKRQGTTDLPLIAGRNKLVFEVIKKMVVQTLSIDSKKIPFKIEGLEQRVSANIDIFQGTKSVRIGGVIDRIDSISGGLEIIDYKTGTTDHHLISLIDLFDKESKKRNKAVFQTLIYCCIWDKMHQDSVPIYPVIYALKTIFKSDQTRIIMKDNGNLEVNYQTIKGNFEPMLTSLLEEIFNPMIPFVQTNVEENCQYCAFTSICGKPSA
jgi:CRISPR/Cas system-associated exonuclease Cas4 (RecB family)